MFGAGNEYWSLKMLLLLWSSLWVMTDMQMRKTLQFLVDESRRRVTGRYYSKGQRSTRLFGADRTNSMRWEPAFAGEGSCICIPQ